ncbi:cisplatin damage response ATP-dependent DNA ligase [Notoacmeibacter ruber]|uniref:DNA ligase (ATP) n=1 Tax=Notoacmeibacter ruber TaxID=2670375 RepID=A0A3L7J8V3_9HYPH|nr:cisplatin damage response ATP-dependent DNA ligase [Notoacmeibacter ruber]RLQ87158.1 cisplatin damage response ATP-dependent DNA ligase [Notoacmeibacter ruber]
MRAFAELLDRLVLTPSRNGKIRLLVDYFGRTPDPDRGYALAAITRDLDIAGIKPGILRALITERMDEILFGYSYDYVGDLAETVSLVWPEPEEPVRANRDPSLGEVVETFLETSRSDGPAVLTDLLDRLDSSGRYAAIKLFTGGMRIGVSARLAKQALAEFGGKDVTEIEELWHGLKLPYEDMFAWLEDKAEKPEHGALALFRPVMLATALEEADYDRIVPETYAAEWKWDGIRVQLVAEGERRRVYSRTGDDIGHSFPDLLEAMNFEGSIDGELLVGHPEDGAVGTFSDLQQRLNRKTVSAKLMKSHPVFVRAYDLLSEGEDDLRALPFSARRKRLKNFIATLDPARFDLSEHIAFADWCELNDLRCDPPHPIIEGVMIKRHESAYVPGRPKGEWFKWKRDPFTIDAVLMYAQRGHGKRSSFYSDYTFGVWTLDEEDRQILVPVGKAYFGFTDAELKLIDKYVRDHTVDRFGPVRSVKATPESGLVLEIAFEGLQSSSRHKSGVAMRFPRVSRLRWDKPSAEADTLDNLKQLLDENRGKASRVRPVRDHG